VNFIMFQFRFFQRQRCSRRGHAVRVELWPKQPQRIQTLIIGRECGLLRYEWLGGTTSSSSRDASPLAATWSSSEVTRGNALFTGKVHLRGGGGGLMRGMMIPGKRRLGCRGRVICVVPVPIFTWGFDIGRQGGGYQGLARVGRM
jgi:hypothetical protein